MFKHTITIFWSDEDEGYIAIAPDLKGLTAFGYTYEDALHQILFIIPDWLEAAKEAGWDMEALLPKKV